MSSASSGRYQSKLFNFVHQRSRRLSERCALAFRQLQVTTSWSVQALFYPMYLLLSTKQAALHSFRQRGPQPDADSHQPTPAADTPIQRVLLAVDVPLEGATGTSKDIKPLNLLASNALMRLAAFLPFKFLKTNHKNSFNSSFLTSDHTATPSHKRPMVQGIASQLSTRTLVLVTIQNEILDILTPQQQQRLQQRIIGEVAAYWRHWRLADVPTTDRVNSLLPWWSFQRITGWAHLSIVVLTLPRKIAASLGQQESRLVRHQAGETDVSPVALVYPYQALTFLDRTVAELESSVVPVSQVAIALTHRSRELIQILRQFSVSWLGRVQQVNSPDDPSTADRTVRIQALIWSAVEYFFGDRRQNLGQTASKQRGLPHPQASQLPLTPPHLLVGADADPWLTMSDLFEQPPPTGKPPHVGQLQDIPQPSERQVLAVNDSVGSIWNKMRRLSHYFLNKVRSPQPPLTRGAVFPSLQGELGRSKSNRFQRSPQPPSGLAAQNGGVATQSRSQGSQIDHAPDWIETPATAVGYVKHPLEKLLEWLDRAMLWLEKVLVRVWQWIAAGSD